MESEIVYSKFLASETDSMGYTTLVFQRLEPSYKSKYIMCVMYPNWDQKKMEIGQEGYLHYMEVWAGVDKWYNSDEDRFVAYKYSNWQFMKFVPKPQKISQELIID